MESMLRKALERNEFLLHFQPQYNLSDREVIGFEALVRWQHPDKGMVSPGEFIPLAEETGLIGPIGEWVLRTACHQNKAWQDAGFEPKRIAVNISARQFYRQDMVGTVQRILAETGLDSRWLELEITESLIMQDVGEAIHKLAQIRELGVHIAIDDFGTGYSSLSYLQKFPVDTLKIDRSFVRDLTASSDGGAIVDAVIALAHSLKLKVVAEGVETDEQMGLLRTKKCDRVQGFLLSRPQPVDRCSRFFDRPHHARDFPAPPVLVEDLAN
jgi:EAL domain-containing protein (putative c-di-GMP-specific phosphodiesterase class I)